MIRLFKQIGIRLLIPFIIFSSCNKKNEYKIEYFKNGNKKKEYCNIDNKLEGVFKEYFENEKLKEIHYFQKGINIDSSLYYFHSNSKERLNQVRYWSDSTSFIKIYNKNGVKLREGNVINEDVNFRIGKWKFFKRDYIDSIVEYKTINNKSYVNQFWLIHKNIDTLVGKGNYYDIYLKDTISLGEIAKVHVFLIQSLFNYNSDIEIILPKDDLLLNDDYSNLFEIETVTFPSLKNDGIPHPDIPNELKPLNHDAEFGLKYDSSGKKRIRGVIIEYINDAKYSDSLRKKERRLFFDKTFFINDTIL